MQDSESNPSAKKNKTKSNNPSNCDAQLIWVDYIVD